MPVKVKDNDDGSKEAYTYGGSAGPLTSEELRSICDIPDTWQEDWFICNKWEAPQDGGVAVLWQAKGKYKPPPASVRGLESLISRLEKSAPRAKKKVRKKTSSKDDAVLLELAPMDTHFGMYAVAQHTGMDYDLDIASNLFLRVIDDLVDKSKPFKPEKILLIAGNDFMHVDNMQNTTTGGTKMDSVSGNFDEIFDRGVECYIQAIDTLVDTAPVDVLLIPGNHDHTVCNMLGRVLDAWYRKTGDVFVDRSIRPTKYYRWGVNLLGFIHGKLSKKAVSGLPLMMAADEKELWAETKFREWHLGHLHSTATMESQGVRTRYLPSLAATDSWHDAHTFRNNIRASEAYLWNDRSGLCGHMPSNIDPDTGELL